MAKVLNMSAPEVPTELGAVASTITKELRTQFGILNRRGVVITSVKGGSIAERWGLLKGDVIEGVSGKTPNLPSEFMQFLATEGQSGRFSIAISRVGLDRTIHIDIDPTQYQTINFSG